MRDLHVVSVSEDGRHVVLAGKAGAAKGGFRVALDDRLSAAVRGDLPRPGEPERGQAITPRDIQTRLRAGETAEAIALSAGVPVARVERFSGPVQGEMAQIIDAARDCHLIRGRLGRSAVSLGVAVDAALRQAVQDPDSSEWTTRRQDDGSWLVTVSWFARARARTASWCYDPATKTVTAMDPASAALAHRDSDEPIRPRPAPKAAKLRKATAAKKAPAKKAPAKKAPAKKAPAKKAPAKKAPAKKAPAKKAPAKKAPAKKTPASRRTGGGVLRAVPDPQPGRAKGTKAATAKGRSSVPAWADVLLGTSPGSDS